MIIADWSKDDDKAMKAAERADETRIDAMVAHIRESYKNQPLEAGKALIGNSLFDTLCELATDDSWSRRTKDGRAQSAMDS